MSGSRGGTSGGDAGSKRGEVEHDGDKTAGGNLLIGWYDRVVFSVSFCVCPGTRKKPSTEKLLFSARTHL